MPCCRALARLLNQRCAGSRCLAQSLTLRSGLEYIEPTAMRHEFVLSLTALQMLFEAARQPLIRHKVKMKSFCFLRSLDHRSHGHHRFGRDVAAIAAEPCKVAPWFSLRLRECRAARKPIERSRRPKPRAYAACRMSKLRRTDWYCEEQRVFEQITCWLLPRKHWPLSAHLTRRL